MNRSFRGLAFCGLFVGLLIASIGCSSRAPVVKTVREGGSVESAEKQLRLRLDNDPDESTIREALEQFNSRVGRKTARVALADAERELLRSELHLGDTDLAEIDRADFTPLDAAYLNESMLLAAVVRGLDLEKLSIAHRARSIVEWVGRQVYIHPRNIPPGPVWYVLESGRGSVAERAYVMLALLRQAGLSAGLVGPASAANVHSFRAPAAMDDPDAVTNPFPFSAVGVLVEKDVLLFDPVAGQAILSADGKSVATFAEVRAGTVKLPGEAAKADPVELFLTPPLAGLSTRSLYLEELLSTSTPIRLHTSLSASRTAWGGARLAGGRVLAWNPANDYFTPTMTLSRYLPTDRGGLVPQRGVIVVPGNDKKRYPLLVSGAEAGVGIVPVLELFSFASLPDVRRPVSRFVGSDRSQAKLAVFELFVSRFNPLRTYPGSVRDRYLHGKVNDAMQQWTGLRESLDKDLIRLRNETKLDEDSDTIFNRVVAAEADLIRARSMNRPDPIATAEQNLQNGLGAMRKVLLPLTIRDTADILGAEYTYSLALAVHEKAERYQMRASPGSEVAVREAWENASDWWQRYLGNFPALDESMKDRDRHARKLADRATSFQKPPTSR